MSRPVPEPPLVSLTPDQLRALADLRAEYDGRGVELHPDGDTALIAFVVDEKGARVERRRLRAKGYKPPVLRPR